VIGLIAGTSFKKIKINENRKINIIIRNRPIPSLYVKVGIELN